MRDRLWRFWNRVAPCWLGGNWRRRMLVEVRFMRWRHAIEVDSFGPAGPGMVACDVCTAPPPDVPATES